MEIHGVGCDSAEHEEVSVTKISSATRTIRYNLEAGQITRDDFAVESVRRNCEV